MKFEFQKNVFETEVAGVKLSGEPAKIELEIAKAHKHLIESSDKITAGVADQKDIKSSMETAVKHIDNAFGKGTCEQVFKNRTVTFHDCLDVVVFLIAALNDFENEKKILYKSFYTPKK